VGEIADQLPTDIEALKAMVAAARAERDAAIAERDQALWQMVHLRHLLRRLQRAQFGRRSEKLDPEQLLLALEDVEEAVAGKEAVEDKKDPAGARTRAKKPRTNRGALPARLPHVDVTIAPEDTNCPCCREPMHVIGEETSKWVDVIPAQFRVIVTHRAKYACRALFGEAGAVGHGRRQTAAPGLGRDVLEDLNGDLRRHQLALGEDH
jgi:transposase